MPSLLDVYELTLTTRLESHFSKNVWFYQMISLDGLPAFQLAETFKNEVFAHIQSTCHENAFVDSIHVRNLFDVEDFYEEGYGDDYPCSRTGNAAPFFVAAELNCSRRRTDMRRGFKRIPYMNETDMAGNVWTAGFITILEGLANQLGFNLSAGDIVFQPVIVKRIPYTTPSGKPAYRLPNDLDELTVYLANQWNVDTRVTTQKSRQVYGS